MNVIIKIFFQSMFMVIATTTTSLGQEITVATYNMRYNIPEQFKKDSIKGIDWPQRFPVMTAMIQFHDFDIFGTQECLYYQLQDVQKLLPQYTYQGVGRDDGKQGGEHNAIFYKVDRFKLLKTGNFWLSETPDHPSMGWNATCCYRMCTWVYLEDLFSGRKLYVFNTHFDYQKNFVRNESSKLILKKIKEIAGRNTVILMGDLNGDRNSEWYKRIANFETLRDTYNYVEIPYQVNGSFNGFGSRNNSDRVIDHVFVSAHLTPLKWGILTDTYYGKYPSDHFPIMVILKFEE